MKNNVLKYKKGRFDEDIKSFMKMTDQNLTRKFRRVSLKALEMVVMRTPVDTGCARANWNVKEGTPDESFAADAADKGGGKTLATGVSKIMGASPDNTLYLTNTTPYIGILESGVGSGHGSKQAPAGMVNISVIELKIALEKGAI